MRGKEKGPGRGWAGGLGASCGKCMHHVKSSGDFGPGMPQDGWGKVSRVGGWVFFFAKQRIMHP